MRFKYYKLTFRQMGIKKPFVFLVVVMVIVILINMYNYKLKSVILESCNANAEQLAFDIASEAVEENMKDINYESLIDIQKNKEDKIIALTSKVMEMNRLSTNITTSIRRKIDKLSISKVKVPMGIFSDSIIFSGYGPKITVKTIPYGKLDIKFKSSFESVGINQTKHKIYLEITTNFKVIIPLCTENQSFKNEIMIAETVIVGDIPQTYYNLEGVENFEKKDTLDLTQ